MLDQKKKRLFLVAALSMVSSDIWAGHTASMVRLAMGIPKDEIIICGPIGDGFRRRLQKESREAQASFSNWTEGAKYSVLRNGGKVYHVASSNGDTFMTTTDRGGWSKCSRDFSIIGTQTFENQPTNLIFEKTCYEWHFGIEEIHGLRYNHAWTLTGLDFMVPEGEVHRISAPAWYEKQEELRLQEEARMKAITQDAELKKEQEKLEHSPLEQAMKDAARASAEGYLRESMYGTLCAKREISHNRSGIDFATVAMQYYDKAVEVLRPFGCFIDRVFEEMATLGGIENLRKFCNKEISTQYFDLTVSADLATNADAIVMKWGENTIEDTEGKTSTEVSANSVASATLAYISSRSLKAVEKASVSWFKGNISSSNSERKEAVRKD